LRGQDLNLRPSGYEATDEGLQTASDFTNPSESLDSQGGVSAPELQAASREHKDFGQPVVSAAVAPQQEADDERPLTTAQAATRFRVPEYLLRKACSEGHLEHLRVVNALWLVPAAVDAFARSWRAKNGRNS